MGGFGRKCALKGHFRRPISTGLVQTQGQTFIKLQVVMQMYNANISSDQFIMLQKAK